MIENEQFIKNTRKIINDSQELKFSEIGIVRGLYKVMEVIILETCNRLEENENRLLARDNK